MTQAHAGIVSLLILAAITSLSGVAITAPDAAYAAVSHKQTCLSIGGDGGDAGDSKGNKAKTGDGGEGEGGDGGNGGRGGEGSDRGFGGSGGDGGKGGKGLGGDGGNVKDSQNGGDGGDGGKSRLACIIVDPDLTIKPTLVVPIEAFEPRSYR